MSDHGSTTPTPDKPPRALDGWTLLGLAGVVIPAAAASFYGQFTTANVAGWPLGLAWTLPVATDFSGFITSRVWMKAPHGKVRDYAAFLTVVTIVLGAVSATLHLLLPPMGEHAPPMGDNAKHLLLAVRVMAGAIPTIMVGLMIHLLAVAGSVTQAKPRKAKPKTTKTVKSTTETKAKPEAVKSAPATSATVPTPSTPRHAAAEVEQSGATVSSITDASWKPEQWAPAVEAARRVAADEGGREVTVTEVIDAVRAATSSGMKRTTAGHLRRAVLAHITSDDTVTDQQSSSSTTTETAEAVGQE